MELLKSLPKQSIDRRRDLIRHLFYTGLSVPLILERLEKHEFLFPITADYDEKYAIAASDIAAIKKEAIAAIAIDEFDIKEQHALYIDRQKFLYHLALQDGNLPLASTLSKDIGKAYGVRTDEPIVIQGNLLDLLKGMQGSPQKKLEEQKVIDVTPEVMPDVPVRVRADAIFHKS